MRPLLLLPLLALACDPAVPGTTSPKPSGGGGGTDDPPEETGDPVDPYVDAVAPVAVISGAGAATLGAAFTLDGSGSYDPQGFALTSYDWSCTDGSVASGSAATLTFASVGTVTCTLTVTSESGLVGTTTADTLVSRAVAQWTVMVFMNGDNELEEYGLGDLNEMEQVGSTDQVHLIAQLDRSASFDRSDDDWRGARRYRVEQDDDTTHVSSPVLEDLGRIDSGDPAEVEAFVAWAAENFPAEHYALVLWDHGWGWSLAPDEWPAVTKGISSDYQTGNDISIAEGELGQILESANTSIGGKLSIIGFDACVMASWEVAYAAMPYADVMVGSQDYEDADGWAYDTAMADLVATPDMSPAELGEAIALRFSETKDSTQSVVDLNSLETLNTALDTLALSLLADTDPAGQFAGPARAALDFDGGSGTDRDMAGFLGALQESTTNDGVLADAGAAAAALDGVVLANYTYGRTAADAQGLSLYTPTRGRVDELYLKGPWAETHWDELVCAARGGDACPE